MAWGNKQVNKSGGGGGGSRRQGAARIEAQNSKAGRGGTSRNINHQKQNPRGRDPKKR